MRNDLISTPPAVCLLNIFNVIWGLRLLLNGLGEGGRAISCSRPGAVVLVPAASEVPGSDASAGSLPLLAGGDLGVRALLLPPSGTFCWHLGQSEDGFLKERQEKHSIVSENS